MGQKVHPNGIRLGITKPWNSTWFANTKDFADNLYSDFQVRQFLTKELKKRFLVQDHYRASGQEHPCDHSHRSSGCRDRQERRRR